MMMIVNMFALFVNEFTKISPAVLIKPKKMLNLDAIIDPRNIAPMMGKITSSCHIRKKIPAAKGNKVISPVISNHLLHFLYKTITINETNYPESYREALHILM